jgi:hypothetical protein
LIFLINNNRLFSQGQICGNLHEFLTGLKSGFCMSKKIQSAAFILTQGFDAYSYFFVASCIGTFSNNNASQFTNALKTEVVHSLRILNSVFHALISFFNLRMLRQITYG